MLVRSLAEAYEHQGRIGKKCVLQQYVPTRTCYRVLCAKDCVIDAFSRITDEIVANITQGATGQSLGTSEKEKRILDLGKAMVDAVGGDIMGCDILEGEDGRLWALEINTSPGLRSYTDQVVDNIADEWINWLSRKYLSEEDEILNSVNKRGSTPC